MCFLRGGKKTKMVFCQNPLPSHPWVSDCKDSKQNSLLDLSSQCTDVSLEKCPHFQQKVVTWAAKILLLWCWFFAEECARKISVCRTNCQWTSEKYCLWPKYILLLENSMAKMFMKLLENNNLLLILYKIPLSPGMLPSLSKTVCRSKNYFPAKSRIVPNLF